MNVDMPKLLIGADPEFFVQRGRHFISAHDFPFGTKAKPQKTAHGFIQIDGIAVECNVTPSSTREQFVENVRGVIEDAQLMVDLHSSSMCTLVTTPSIFFGKRRLQKLPPWAGELGCRPDYDAWTGQQNRSPDPNSPLRTASGHLHIGWTKNKPLTDRAHFEDCCRMACQLDYFLGLPSLLWDNDRHSNRRRDMYGQAGAFRSKPYGLEYRVLSNKWTETEELTGWVFDATCRAVRTLFDDGIYYPKMYGNLARTCINSNFASWAKDNKRLAKDMLQ